MVHAGGPEAFIDIVVHEEWAPIGADRFLKLVDDNYFDGCPLYRFIPEFIVQWGIPTDAAKWKKWGENKVTDDPVKMGNKKGFLSFATSGPSAHHDARTHTHTHAHPRHMPHTGQQPLRERTPRACVCTTHARRADALRAPQTRAAAKSLSTLATIPTWTGRALRRLLSSRSRRRPSRRSTSAPRSRASTSRRPRSRAKTTSRTLATSAAGRPRCGSDL